MRNGALDKQKKMGDSLDLQKKDEGVRGQNFASSEQQKRVLIFARVSTKDQSTNDQQVEAIKKGLKPGEKLIGIISEKKSASSEEGEIDVLAYIKKIPGLQAVLDLAKQQRFEKLYVWKWDRLSRDPAFLHLIVKKLLADTYHIEAESLIEGTNALVRGMSGNVAEHEIETKLLRQKLGYEKNLEKGRILAKPPLGYMKDKDGRIHVQEKKMSIVREVFKLCLKGLNKKEIHFSTLLSLSTIQNVLKQPSYAGISVYEGKPYKLKTTPIITLKDWNTCQDLQKHPERKIVDPTLEDEASTPQPPADSNLQAS